MEINLRVFDCIVYSCLYADAPVTTLELGRNLNEAGIKEGSDVYFDCIIDANPPARKVYWTHNVSKFFLNITLSTYQFCCFKLVI